MEVQGVRLITKQDLEEAMKAAQSATGEPIIIDSFPAQAFTQGDEGVE